MEASDELRAANERGRRIRRQTPPATAARYDRKSKRIIISLSSGVDVSFSPQNAEGLERATRKQLEQIELTPSGLGIHFPKLDADIYVPALLQGVLGSRKWMAANLGQAGGKSTSTAKRRASRTNGHLGGRPRKLA
jgi:Protein of unknown function (DUF2442)